MNTATACKSHCYTLNPAGDVCSCRGFHVSEDVFAGYNHTLRGARTKFLEYISVGKGRDMGFDSINSFEAKVRRVSGRNYDLYTQLKPKAFK